MNQATQQRTITWLATYLPGTTDSFTSNEIIVAGLSAYAVWAQLNDTTCWPTYYSNMADIRFHDGSGPLLGMDARFRFTTFGLPIEAQTTEYVPSVGGRAARIAWHGWVKGDTTTRLDMIHAQFFEDLFGGCVRVLTRESQIGIPAQKLARTLPDPAINGHQEWMTGLTRAAHDV